MLFRSALAGAGRPKKGERLLNYIERLVNKPTNTQRAAEAHLRRLLREDAVGARALADHRDTFYGLPKQTLVLEQQDNPFFSLLAGLAQPEAPAQLPAPDTESTL